MSVNIEDKLSFLEKQIESANFKLEWEDSGYVISVGDGVATLFGLTKVQAGEIIEFENGITALALNLEENSVGVVILDKVNKISEGTRAKRTGKIASVKVNESLIGRVLDGFGNPIDGCTEIKDKYYEMPIERKAPGIRYRQPVNEPLQTGIKSIDSMIPIGKGQRELIIGDMKTGKTSIAIETILNQKQFYDKGEPVYCIYVAVGQKQSTVKNVYEKLRKHGALQYTIIVTSSASDPAAMQYYAPFTGAAIGEFFRDTGRNALIIYDDLSKQAVAYREISLLLERPPGREAYPGDIFYLHSRLLERAARIIKNDEIAKEMNDLPISIKDIVKGGGSLTALPIVETKGGDVSAYIPTNVISITDGQLFLDSNLFNSGFKPAINIGISVSRVGSSAQNKAMKKIAGKLKLSQAEFAEIEAFSKFSIDLDPGTQYILNRGRRNNEIFKQKLNRQLTTGEEASIIYASMNGYLDKIELKDISRAENKFLSLLHTNNEDLINKLSNGEWDKNIEDELIKACEKFQNSFK